MIPVTVSDFARAETDRYFASTASEDAFGRLRHSREITSIEGQRVVRMNRDTIYSSGVFDLEAAPVIVTLPEPGGRFMSLQSISEDHYSPGAVYAPGRFRFRREDIGTRYLFIVVRLLVDPRSHDDMHAAHLLQDAILVDQAQRGAFKVPAWDQVSLGQIRELLLQLGQHVGDHRLHPMFGTREEVDPVIHLIGTASGWGGNPEAAAVYKSVMPEANDGTIEHRLTVGQVPVDGFWSISVYNANGFFEANRLDAYSVNSVTALRDADGAVTVQFGGRPGEAANYLPIMPGWNYTVRLYRPRREILDGSWTFPLARPVQARAT